MINDNSIQLIIDKQLIADNLKRDAEHEPSGLLSASQLFQPVRFQVMKTIGVPKKTFEPYLLGKFERGHDVEQKFVNKLKRAGILEDTQKEVRYREVIGFIDAVVNSNALSFKKGMIPHEIKSVTNAKLKRIASTEVDYHYKLQAGFYAIATRSEVYAIDIISAEDYRVNTYIFDVKDIAKDIEDIITRYDEAIKVWNTTKKLPELVVNEKVKWATNPDYAPFALEWLEKTDEQIVKDLSK